MMTPRELFLELLKPDGQPDRQLCQYEALHMCLNDPINTYLRGNRKRGTVSKDRWGTTISFPADAPGPMPVTTDGLAVCPDVTHWRDTVHAPDIDSCTEGWEACRTAARAACGKEKLLAGFMGTGIFEQCHFLMGFEDTLTNLYEHPDEMHQLIEYITEYRLRYVQLLIDRLQPDVIFSHDDWGTKDALFMHPDMLAFIQNYTDMGFFSIIIFLLVGAILTMIVQASAATMAITLIMCANGWIDYHLGVALVLGENIGTTITANFAALTGNTQARRAALAHLMFNVFGVIWVLILFYPFTNAVSWFVTHFMKITDPSVAISFKLAAFHTAFNISNTCVMIWFVNLIEKTVCAFINPKQDDEEYRLRYISGGMLSTAELSILQAQKEIVLFAKRTTKMFGMVKELLYEKNDDAFSKTLISLFSTFGLLITTFMRSNA